MPQFVATVHRTAGQITEAFEHNREPAHWTDFDVWLVLAKMHWFISDRGNRKVPARLTRQGELTFSRDRKRSRRRACVVYGERYSS